MADPIEVLTSKIDSLARAVAEGFDRVERRLDAHDARFDAHDARFDGHDARFDEIPAQFAAMREYVEAGHAKLTGEIGRVERKLDQFIDSQLRR